MPGAFKLDHLQPLKPILFWQFSICFIFILGGHFLLPQRANSEKREKCNSRTEWDRGGWVPGAFKLDHLQPFQSILFWQFSICITFILGGQFFLPQRANSERREFFQLQKWMRQRSFYAWGIQTGPFTAWKNDCTSHNLLSFYFVLRLEVHFAVTPTSLTPPSISVNKKLTVHHIFFVCSISAQRLRLLRTWPPKTMHFLLHKLAQQDWCLSQYPTKWHASPLFFDSSNMNHLMGGVGWILCQWRYFGWNLVSPIPISPSCKWCPL